MLTYIESWGCRDPFGSPVTILFLEVITLRVVMTLLLLLQLTNREMSKKKIHRSHFYGSCQLSHYRLLRIIFLITEPVCNGKFTMTIAVKVGISYRPFIRLETKSGRILPLTYRTKCDMT